MAPDNRFKRLEHLIRAKMQKQQKKIYKIASLFHLNAH